MATQITLQSCHNIASYPSSERLFESKFPSFTLSTERSPNSLRSTCVDIAVLLSTHGLIAESVDLIEIGSKFSQEGLFRLAQAGLYFAYEAADIWPSMVPNDHKTAEHLDNLDSDPLEKFRWGQIVLDPKTYPPLAIDEDGLGRLVKHIDDERQEPFAYPCKHPAYQAPGVCVLFANDVRSMAIDFALRLGREDEAGRILVKRGTDPTSVAHSRRAWRLLKDGKMFSQMNVEEAKVQYRRLKYVLNQRLENGPLNPLKDKTMLELVEILDEQTMIPRDDDDEIFEEAHANTFRSNRSIRHEPATASEISALEEKFNVTLPNDYKEFLKISNGLGKIWNGHFKQGFLGQVNEIQKGEHVLSGDDALEFQLINWTELPYKVQIENWPKLDQQRALHVSSLDEEGDVWLVEPSLVEEARKAFWEMYNDPGTNDEARTAAQKVISDQYGSVEEFDGMEWAVVAWSHWGGGMQVFKSFRGFLEHLVIQGKDQTAP